MRQSFVDRTITLPFPRVLYKVGSQWLIEWNCKKEGNPVNKEFLNQIQGNQKSKDKIFSVYDQTIARKSHIRPALFIFHVSRCGSTLTANYLATDKENRVYNEPRILSMPLSALNEGDLGVKENFTKYIDSLLIGALPKQKRLVIKLSARYLKYLPLFEKFYPDVPRWLIVRNPTEVLASNVITPPYHISNEIEGEYSEEKSIPTILKFWSGIYSDALKYSKSFTETMDYRNLTDSLKRMENNLWKVTFDPERESLIEDVMSKSSKKNNKLFQENLNKKLAYEELFSAENQECFRQMERDYARILEANS